jgi:threonylcarbamoyladenosine tRNA methylthiotransferase CDKAL1
MASVYLETHGCTLNQSESEEIVNLLRGHNVVESAHDAQIIVLNTCAVVERTEKRMLKRIKQLYQQSENRKLIVSGCLVEQFGDLLRAEYPESVVVQSDHVASYINAHYKRKPAAAPERGTTAKVKIAHGCSGSCSYCVVRLIRGPTASRSIETVFRDVQRRIQNGAQQIFLAAQDAAAYGKDRGCTLPDLVEALCELEQDFRLRIGMMNVSSIFDILEELVETFGHPKVYKFLHLPVQSGSDRVLALMERGHTIADFKHVIQEFRQKLGDVTISTDFIVGFPTETNDDFRATMRLLREVSPLKVNITRFSPRKGTKAFNLNPVISRIAKERSRMLTAEHHRIAYERNWQSLGRAYSALAVERGKNESTILYTDNYRPIVVEQNLPLGVRYTVQATSAKPTYLIGTLG